MNIDDYYSAWDKPKFNKVTDKPILDVDGNVKTRRITSTKKELKIIQKRIYKFILSKVKLPSYFFGGIAKKDNILNAKLHQGNKYIFTTDLRSFFPSISHNRVFEIFIERGFHPTIARKLTQLITYQYQVPQGVSTSTLIANLVFEKTGNKIQSFAEENQLTFSIFVDDITISSKFDFKDKVPIILDLIIRDGYKISHRKTFYKTKNPIITGIVCQNNRIKVPQTYNKQIKRVCDIVDDDSSSKLFNKLKGMSLYRERVNSTNK